MAHFNVELPTEIVKQMQKIYGDTEKIFGKMTEAGAKVVKDEVVKTVPVPELGEHVTMTRIYRTPTDGGINTKVIFHGYIPFKDGRKWFSRRAKGKTYKTDKGIPAAFVANIFEYGRSGAPFPKKPFLRKAFAKRTKIRAAMLKAQKEASGGILDDE